MCVRLCVCVCVRGGVLKAKGDMLVCLHAYTYCRLMCSLCNPPPTPHPPFLFSRVHVEADGSRFGWRRLGTRRSAETCLCVGSRGAGAAAAPSQPDCTPAAIPNASTTSLAGCAPALFLPALRLGKKTGGFLLWIYFIACFLLFAPQDMWHTWMPFDDHWALDETRIPLSLLNLLKPPVYGWLHAK